MISEAATVISKLFDVHPICHYIPMPLSFVELLARLDFSSFARSGVMVAAEGEREKVFARGARCVSLSSVRE